MWGRQRGARKGAAAVVSVLVVAELLLTAGAVRWALATHYRTPPPIGLVPTSRQAAPLAVSRRWAPRPAIDLRTGVPLRLRVPALSISAAVSPVDAEHGALSVPSDVAKVGWWRAGAAPGSRVGTVVIDGHVDSASQGRGALFPLSRAVPGDSVTLTTARGDIRYTVVARRAYPKTQLPADVFDTGGRARLVLITCGGRFDARTRHYTANVVVYALPN